MCVKNYDNDYHSDGGKGRKDKCCDKKNDKGRMKHYKNCVEDVLEAILFAQKKAKRDDCTTGCKQSIDELLGKKKVKKNTIPFILYCGCKPFEGTGVTTYSCHSKREKLKCVNTHVFKIKALEKECAVLELLAFKSDLRGHKDCQPKHGNSVCKQIDDKHLDDLVSTGICITVDLSCFCAVTCLPAVSL